MRVEQQQRPIVRRRAHVVDEQSHADATISRAHHRSDQQLADRVVVPDVVLQVEAALGEIDEGEARKERIGTAGIRLMPDGPFNSVILRAATRPSDVESAVSASADEGLDVCVFGSEAQPAHTRRAMPGTANRPRRSPAGRERVKVRRLRVVRNGLPGSRPDA